MDLHSDNKPIRIVLVEDDLAFQHRLMDTIMAAPDMVLVAVANDRVEALALLDQDAVDVLLVDLGLPDGSGIDVIRAAQIKWPACNIMVSTAFGDEMHVMHSLEAGASGYLLKGSTPHSMASEIRILQQGGSPISPLIARQILTRFRKTDASPLPAAPASAEKQRSVLSNREHEVLEYITKGFTVEEIAELMSVSRNTVSTFVRRVYKKLEVRSKTEAIYEARNQGLIGA
ncbi:MAG TPA: response regulator transcription factor [Herbaspirillum sp.]